MANAIRFDTLDADLAVQGTLYFERKEAAAGSAVGRYSINEQVAQNGAPTMFLLMDNTNPYRTVPIQIRIAGATTLGKLLTLRDHLIAAGGNLLRMYPKLQSDTSLFYDGYIDPASIPEESFFSGENAADTIVSLEFRETTKDGQSVVLDDIIVE